MSLALVTGATGFVGGHVAADLLSAGWDVRALARPRSLASGRLPDGCEPAAGDLRDAAAVERAVDGADAVFHVAALYSLARHRAAEVYRNNVDGTSNVLRAAGRRGAPVVHTSSVATIGLPADGSPGDEDTPLPPSQVIGAYKRSKVDTERLALAAAAEGRHVVVVNPTAPVGPGDAAPTPTGRIVSDFLAGRIPAYVNTGLNVVDVRDVATGHRLALEQGAPGRRYILGNANMTLREILAALAAIAGRRAPRVRLPHAVAIAVAAVDETIEGRMLGREPLAPLDGALMARKRMFVERLARGARAGDAAVAGPGRPGGRGRVVPRAEAGGVTTGTMRESPVRDEARDALRRAEAHLRGLQSPEGYWWGELESNATITAEHVFLLHALGLADDGLRRRLANELLATRGADGGWRLWHSGPADLSTTAEAYYALRLCGLPVSDPALAAAREVVLAGGGVNRARFFTKLWLAVLGRYPWRALPVLPPEMILLPPRAPMSPYRFASWARGTFVALMIVLTRRPTFPQPVGLDELFLEPPGAGPPPRAKTPGPWTPALTGSLALARLYDRRPIRPLRRMAEARVVRWICERQEADGSWGGIQPPWVYSILALHAVGFPLDHPVIARGLAGFEETFALDLDDGGRLRIQACLSPVWDTALAAVALADAGARPGDPALEASAGWLLAREVTRYGDWHQTVRSGRPGGWSFEFANENYPDTDDTAEVLLALRRAGRPASDPAVRRGVNWLLAMQSSDGGWGSFDVDNDRAVMTQIPICDFGEVIDPPTEDVTAHVVEALVECGLPADHPAVRSGVAYLWRTQREDGSWWGRWGVNHVYGTGAVLPALAAAGQDMSGPGARRAVSWLAGHQNPDGGWGESVLSYRDPAWIGRGDSTASQTAWALMGLLAADPDHPAVEAGLAYLARSQRPDGSWDEPWFTGTGFPMDFMINYHLYRQVFPVTALGRALR